jgi:hypothetical protein
VAKIALEGQHNQHTNMIIVMCDAESAGSIEKMILCARMSSLSVCAT